jgi:predicted transposase YbfD/YdcC
MDSGTVAARCVTAESVDKNNRSRYERRSLRWIAAEAETLCCVGLRSVVEITREIRYLKGKNKGKRSVERVVYLCSLEPDEARGAEILERIRRYWGIESGLHQRLDVSCREDASRVRDHNALLVLGILRRAADGVYMRWRRHCRNKRESRVKDFHVAMGRFNQRTAFKMITKGYP